MGAYQPSIALTISGPLARQDIPGLYERVFGLLEDAEAIVVDCDVSALSADAVTVDALARIQLAACRRGCRVRLQGASGELRALLAFAGLRDVF